MSTTTSAGADRPSDINQPSTALRNFEIALSVLIVAVSVWAASRQMFWDFQPFDDEGYFLISLIRFVTHGGLYDTTFTQYGPFLFAAQKLMHAVLGLPYTTEGARELTLFYWIASSSLAAAIAYRLARRVLLSSVAFLVTLVIESVVRHEPGHPQELILVLTFLGLGASLFVSTHRRAAGLVLGLCAGFLCLTKINVGVFYFAAVVVSYAFLFPKGRLRTIVLLPLAGAAVLLPTLLMWRHLPAAYAPWVLTTEGITCLLFAASRAKWKLALQLPDLIWPVAGFFAAALLTLTVVLQENGTTLRTLLSGVLLAPLRYADVLYHGFPQARLRFLAALALWPIALALWAAPEKIRLSSAGAARLKMGAAILILLVAVFNYQWTPNLALPLASLLFWQFPGSRWSPPDLFARFFLSCLLVFGFLQAYPVAASQFSIGLAPVAVWACVLLYDGLREWEAETLNGEKALAYTSGALALAVLLCWWAKFSPLKVPGPPLDLPGATHIRIAEREGNIYRELVSSIRANCDVLFEIPGLFSLNLWSGVPTPNGLNMDNWMNAFSSGMQSAIVRDLERRKRPCIVYNPVIMAQIWNVKPETPLADSSVIGHYVRTRTRSVLRVQDFELRTGIQ